MKRVYSVGADGATESRRAREWTYEGCRRSDRSVHLRYAASILCRQAEA